MKAFLQLSLFTSLVLSFLFAFTPHQAHARSTDSDIVRLAQMHLKEQGFLTGPVDGIEGPMTDRAITAFQRSHGLVATGQLTPETFSALAQDHRTANSTMRYSYPVTLNANPPIYDHPVYNTSYTGTTMGSYYVTSDHIVVATAP